ncbi:MAG: DUF5655 domain-containing protein [Thermoleophilaceae bacterium]
MPTPEDGIESQLRNIEATYGKSRDDWYAIIRAAGKTKHTEVVALLKSEYGLKHGAAHRLSLLARQQETGAQGQADAVAALYAGKRAALRPIHDKLIEVLERFDGVFEIVPKKGYVSLRRAKQFAMIQPSTASRVDLGLVLPELSPTGRLESAAKFNALFTHRVRIAAADEVDPEVVHWLGQAYERAGS